MQENIPNTPIFFTMGNHEALPVNLFDFTGNYSSWEYTDYPPLFRQYLDQEAFKSMQENLYFS